MKPYSVFDQHGLYFITSTITEWHSIFTYPEAFQIMLNSWDFCRREKGFLIHYYVIMPNHWHMIVSSQKDRLSDILRDMKRHTSRQLSDFLREGWVKTPLNEFAMHARLDQRGNDFKVYQEGFHPIELSSEKMLAQKADYIHHNPVKKGFVLYPEDWLYSSARNYFKNDDSVFRVDYL
jgi:REP element-mobilizing transposase RayT